MQRHSTFLHRAGLGHLHVVLLALLAVVVLLAATRHTPAVHGAAAYSASLSVSAQPVELRLNVGQSGSMQWVITENSGVGVTFYRRTWQVAGCLIANCLIFTNPLEGTGGGPIGKFFLVGPYGTATWQDYPSGAGCSHGYDKVVLFMTFAGTDDNGNAVSGTGGLRINCRAGGPTASVSVGADPSWITPPVGGSGSTDWVLSESNGVGVRFTSRTWQLYGCSDSGCDSTVFLTSGGGDIGCCNGSNPLQGGAYYLAAGSTVRWHDYPGPCNTSYRNVVLAMTFAGTDDNGNNVSATGYLQVGCGFFG